MIASGLFSVYNIADLIELVRMELVVFIDFSFASVTYVHTFPSGRHIVVPYEPVYIRTMPKCGFPLFFKGKNIP